MAADNTGATKTVEKSMEQINEVVSKMNLLSFRKIDDIKKLAKHFQFIINHPFTQENPIVLRYLISLNETHRKIYTQKREGVQVEYIFASETKSNIQRQRFNSLPVSEVPELLKNEFPKPDNAEQVHICTDCNVAIELNDEEPLMESLQKHFNLDVHLPKLKRESIDVAEPITLPNMSRRLSAMAISGEATSIETIVQINKPAEKLERLFIAKLEASLIRHLPDNSEASINNAVKFYQQAYDKLCQETSTVDFSVLTASVAPIIMSIKDNVNQNFSTDANKNFEIEDNEQGTPEKPAKIVIKKHRYYGPIESMIINLLSNHNLLQLIDDRTGKPAFFCVACEYYTLRFRYDSVLNHVFSDTHIHNLAFILQADKHVPFVTEERTMEKIHDVNNKFLMTNNIEKGDPLQCGLCKVTIDSTDASIIHILDENHLNKMSDKIYRKFKNNKPNAQIPDEWGQKNLDWAKYLATSGKTVSNKDPVIIENFIKPSGKIANYCPCCDSTLKGPRQILFNHIRQKKHLRNAAPHKLALLYKNYARSAEYYAGFGNFFLCAVCPKFVGQPSFAAMIEHFDSDMHIQSIAKLIRMAMYTEDEHKDRELLLANKISTKEEIRCEFCNVTFHDQHDAILHVLSNVKHHNLVADSIYQSNKGDIISIYLKGNYILHSEGSTFSCVVCKCVFNSLRTLLLHLVFAEHFNEKLTSENVFRFYLELKHNINMLARNKYVYTEFGKLKCGVCDAYLEDGENAKRHVGNVRHRENMGASYVSVNLDVSAAE